ncbi:hypothetical protein [Saccharopolyspora oryzae]|uniref:Uncharacterized protein n=1 Tax=Saccharopolyspora oryzae TaxID=2997343 RepID=A0ABT4V0F2_9PSEU|nr:hypothetical protein [Saccharopolyspora oryzae]MDA3627418.1 hypothetical protein [Saccharopolyspora oryzae]
MRTLVDAEPRAHYGLIFLESGQDSPDMSEAFRGQANGICGAGKTGYLIMLTGLHTGPVGFTE